MATETIFSVYLLLYLGKESIARFFKPVNELQPKPRNNILRILSIVVIISMALIGGCFLLIKHNLSSLVNGMEISLEDVQTGAVQRLTQDGWNFDPSFSADSNKIVFIHTVKNQQKESYELKMLSLNDKTVSTILREENTLNKPFLGPDLASIYFISGQNGQQDIWKMSLLDHKKVKITTDGQEKSNLILSPNGQWFAYIQNNELYLLSQDGKQKRRITTTTNFLYTPDCPAWSSDSKSIVYKSFTDLVVVVIDGNLQERISLAGLNNVSNIFYDTRDNDIIYFKARPAQEATLDTYLYSYSKKIGTVKLLHKSSLIEQGYNMSLNGKYFVFEKPWDDKSKKNN